MQLKMFMALAALSFAAPVSAATTFQFLFDTNQGDGVQLPIAGTGSFFTPDTLGVGDYSLTSLSGYSLNINFFLFGTNQFTAADIVDPDFVMLRITNSGFGNQLRLDRGAPSSPALLTNAGGVLELDGDVYVVGNLAGPFRFGDYQAIQGAAPAVPEPSSWLMLIAGFGLVGAMARRRAAALAA